MRFETKNTSELWSPEVIDTLKRKGCGLINCRPRLEARNPVSEEIQKILGYRFGGSQKSRQGNL